MTKRSLAGQGWVTLAFGTAMLISGGWLSAAVTEGPSLIHATQPSVILRAKHGRSRQPRPASAPVKHLDRQADTAVELLGIEPVEKTEPTTTDPARLVALSRLD